TIDAVGSDRLDRNYIKRMADSGAQVKLYHALGLLDFGAVAKLNNRSHRKLLIVDGVVGFTGGAGVADDWMGNAQSAEHWRDTHYRLEGPAVAQVERAVCDIWLELTGRVLHWEGYCQALRIVGAPLAEV